MYSRVLAPLDGSALAEQVLPYARLVTASLGSRIELLRVIEPPPLGDWDLAQGTMIPHAELAQDFGRTRLSGRRRGSVEKVRATGPSERETWPPRS